MTSNLYPRNGTTCSAHRQLIATVDAASIRAEAAVQRAADAVQKATAVENQILALQKDLMKVVVDLQEQTAKVIATQSDHTKALNQANETMAAARDMLTMLAEAIPKKRNKG